MSLVVLEHASLSFAGRVLFAGLNLRIGEQDRVGLIGRNGSGKSSLLKILAGRLELGQGTVRRARGLRVGYLPQDLPLLAEKTLLSSVLESVPGRVDLERSLEAVEEGLAKAATEPEQLALAQKLADLHEEVGRFESLYSPHEALRILAGLGFDVEDRDRAVSSLSGGWRMRAALAALLFQKPDLLLLDEPTNHLDVPSVVWLGEFLRKSRHAFVLVCHDRAFLNEQVQRVVAFEAEALRQYTGNYDAYRHLRAEELEVLERRAVNIAREKEAAERFIRRFRSQASKARAVQSRIKSLERIDPVELPRSEQTLSFRFPPSQRAGQDVITLAGVGHRYGEKQVFDAVDLSVRRADRVAIVGANGNGKTTLLKIMARQLSPSQGTVRLGSNVEIGYYAQHVAELLDERSTVLEEVWRKSVLDNLQEVRTVLGTMLFHGDDIEKPIAVLSGGEKARVALACLMVHPGNVILMDEPTNHLDLASSEALAAALATFDGTLVFASHNRSFAGRLATRVWDVSANRVEEFPGTLDEYIHWCGRGAGNTQHAPAKERSAKKPLHTEEPDVKKPAMAAGATSRRKGRPSTRRARELERRVAQLEQRIGALEQAQAERSVELCKPQIYSDPARYGVLLSAYRVDESKLAELMERWEQAQASLGDLSK